MASLGPMVVAEQAIKATDYVNITVNKLHLTLHLSSQIEMESSSKTMLYVTGFELCWYIILNSC